jgi:hypothetical protein
MSQYLVAIHLPDNFNPSAADEAAVGRDIDTLNERRTFKTLRRVGCANDLEQEENKRQAASKKAAKPRG